MVKEVAFEFSMRDRLVASGDATFLKGKFHDVQLWPSAKPATQSKERKEAKDGR